MSRITRESALARWAKTTPAERSAVARRVANARWANKTSAERLAEYAKGRS